MAKLKGPLFSLGASQQLGKALVFFTWKGLNVVREYVIPSNPKTTLQKKQRGYLTDAVDNIHRVQALPTYPLAPEDVMADALWASVYPTPRTWFNQRVKNQVEMYIKGHSAVIYHGVTVAPGALKLKLKGFFHAYPISPTAFDVVWGTSKTTLVNKQNITAAEFNAGKDIINMPKATKIFLQLRPSAPGTTIGAYSGIYYEKTS